MVIYIKLKAMEKIMKIHDDRIDADNYLLEMTIGDYYEIVKDRLQNNEYQRRRVKNSSSIYGLLKEDLVKGCVIPPIVLAYSDNLSTDNIEEALKKAEDKLVILDGLQRSYTIKEIVDSCANGEYGELTKNPLGNKIRVEVYVGINRLGVLYRMLTLNTGQTQMSARHQIEIIYSDYRKNCRVKGVTLISEADDKIPNGLGQYKFRDVVDGFTSYMQKDHLPLDRMDILANVKNLKRLSENSGSDDLFYSFIESYNNFVKELNAHYSGDLSDLLEEGELNKAPFGNTVVKIFSKSQPLTGYGHAVMTLKEFGAIDNFSSINELLSSFNVDAIESGLHLLLVYLDKVSALAKKIGNDQRLYFYHFFKALFDRESDGFLDIEKSAEQAYRQYERITL